MDTTTKQTATWVLDPVHSELTFKVRHMMITNVKGAFNKFTVDVSGDNIFEADLLVTIDPSSISTNNDDRDTHLKSADFFDAESHREITFRSISLKQKDGDEYELKGMLTIKGVSREITLEVEYGGINKDPWGNEKAGFSVKGKINRKDFGLNWNATLETGGVLVSEDVKIDAEIQFVKS